MMKKWQAVCKDDNWKSEPVEAEDKMAAAAMLAPVLGAHVAEMHKEMVMPTDPTEAMNAVADHVEEVMAAPAI